MLSIPQFPSHPGHPFLPFAGQLRTLLLATLLLGACRRPSEPVVCTQELRFGIGVQVRDSVTGQFIAGGSTLVVTDGAYRESVTLPDLRENDERALTAAPERTGVYTLVVSRTGYRDWSRAGIGVTRDECHVLPVALTALLQRP